MEIDAGTPLLEILHNSEAHRVISELVPSLLESVLLHTYITQPIGRLLETEEGVDAALASEILDQLRGLVPNTTVRPTETAEAEFSVDYEPTTADRGSRIMAYPSTGRVWDRFEITVAGPQLGNPFVEVRLSAIFTAVDGSEHHVLGFYDGAGEYRIRFLPSQPGRWAFAVSSNARSMDGLSGEFWAEPPSSHGPVKVADGFDFAYADGTRYVPIGTTCYAWTHQPVELQEQTLRSLQLAPFTKLRMCVFPKSYAFNTNEPDRYPFARTSEGWDGERFDPQYWEDLERRIDQLAELGIEADVILFHAYDRWGFATMDPEADDRYVRYAVARLSAFRNIWWSLANEFDLLDKADSDWERWAAIIQQWDAADHLRSIHNCFRIYDQSRSWITHVSMQRTDTYRTAENVSLWREQWSKPVVVDECSYEGNIDQGWGNISAKELTRRAWEGTIRGGYVGHGETYVSPDDVLWWSKGGTLHGSSPARLSFLAEIVRAAPGGRLQPLELEWDVPVAGVLGEELLYYFGFARPAFRWFFHDPAVNWEVELIDTWAMTIHKRGIFSGRFRIEMPARKYFAIRMRRHS